MRGFPQKHVTRITDLLHQRIEIAQALEGTREPAARLHQIVDVGRGRDGGPRPVLPWRAGEDLQHLVVGRLLEVRVPGTDGAEVPGGRDAYDLVDLGAQPLGRLGGAHGRREHDASRSLPSQRVDGCPGRHARGQTIVDEDDGSIAGLDLAPIAAIPSLPALHLLRLRRSDPFELLRGDPQLAHGPLVHDSHAGSDGPHTELGLPGSP